MKPSVRAGVFALAGTSILAVLGELVGVWSMAAFTRWVFLPAMVVLIAWALFDRQARWLVVVGGAAGFIAAVVYDIFRLPFVFARELHIDAVVPAMPLFRVFNIFGEMILQRPEDWLTHLVGWAYHFSNGITFGVMYLALFDDAARRSWWWGVLFAVVIEAGLLLSPYAGFFKLGMSTRFVVVTLAAHIVFGVTMGVAAQKLYSVGRR